MKLLIFSIILLFSTGIAFGQSPDPLTVNEGQPKSWQTATTDFGALVAELGLAGQQRIKLSATTCNWFMVNGSMSDGQHATYLVNGKAVTVWLGYTVTRWTKCPNGDCTTFKGRWAGVTTGKLKT